MSHHVSTLTFLYNRVALIYPETESLPNNLPRLAPIKSAWKWLLVLFLLAASLVLVIHKPQPSAPFKVELLPFSETPPRWDGSDPYLVISAIAGSSPLRYNTAISLIQPTAKHDSPVNDFLVDLHTGRFILRHTDLFVPDVMPLSLTRTYISWDDHSRAFGIGGNHPYDICPTGPHFPYSRMELFLEGDQSLEFRRISKGVGYADAVFRHEETSSEFFGSQIAWNGDGWTMNFPDGRKFLFPDAYKATTFAQGAPTEMLDASGHKIELKRDGIRNLQELISPSLRTIAFKYDHADRIIEAKDSAGNFRSYGYDSSGHVATVSDQDRVLYRFEYRRLMNERGYDPWLLADILDGDWHPILTNKYLWGRVSEQRLADGKLFRYKYRLRDREVIDCTVTLPTGENKTFSFRDGILIAQN